MKKVAIIPLVMGLAIGGIAIKMGLSTLQEARANSQQELFTVVVAATDIDATSALEPAMLTTVKTPKTPLLGDKCFGKIEDAVGRVVAVTIPKGTPVREELLAAKGSTAGLTVRIMPGFRAVSVKVDEVTGVAYQILPGSAVDVIAVMSVKNGRKDETVCRTILQNIKVGAVGRTLSASNEDEGKGKVAKSVTLLVRDADAPLLHLAQTRGKLTLALRSGDDDFQSKPGNATESELLTGIAAKPANDEPAAAPVKMHAELVQAPKHQLMVVHAGQTRQFDILSGGTVLATGGNAGHSADAPREHSDDTPPPPPDDPEDLSRQKQERPPTPG